MEKRIKAFAQELRTNGTKEEKRLWYDLLRNCPVQFRRQVPFGPYILDFYCAQEMEMSRNVQSGNTQNLKSPFVNQAACCACTHSRYFAGGSPSGLRV